MAEPEETPPDLTVDIELADKAFGEMRDLGNWLSDAERQNEWFGPLLFHLIRSTLREYQHLKTGYAKSTPFLAWACRNMLELDIITQHVLGSEKGARILSMTASLTDSNSSNHSEPGSSSMIRAAGHLRSTKRSPGFRNRWQKRD
jgi:hypothetical protein